MIRPRLVSLSALAGVLLVGGCTGNQELEKRVHDLHSRDVKQIDILKKRNELLNRKLNDLNETIQELRDANDRLSIELSSYATRPEEVKLEIISEVNTRFGAIAKGQEDFKLQVTTMYQEDTAALQDSLDAEIAAMQKTLQQHEAFVHFISSQQDSINRVFANRFDSRPWYQSVIGKWDDMNREAAQQPETP